MAVIVVVVVVEAVDVVVAVIVVVVVVAVLVVAAGVVAVVVVVVLAVVVAVIEVVIVVVVVVVVVVVAVVLEIVVVAVVGVIVVVLFVVVVVAIVVVGVVVVGVLVVFVVALVVVVVVVSVFVVVVVVLVVVVVVVVAVVVVGVAVVVAGVVVAVVVVAVVVVGVAVVVAVVVVVVGVVVAVVVVAVVVVGVAVVVAVVVVFIVVVDVVVVIGVVVVAVVVVAVVVGIVVVVDLEVVVVVVVVVVASERTARLRHGETQEWWERGVLSVQYHFQMCFAPKRLGFTRLCLRADMGRRVLCSCDLWYAVCGSDLCDVDLYFCQAVKQHVCAFSGRTGSDAAGESLIDAKDGTDDVAGVFSGHAASGCQSTSRDVGMEKTEANVSCLLRELQDAVTRIKSGGEIPCHFTTLTTAIYHWQDLAKILERYEAAVTQRRHGRSDPLEPSERKLSVERRRVLKYPGVVAWFTGYKMELFYKHVLKYEDGEGVFEWGAGGIMHLHSINFGSQMPRVDPAQDEWRIPCVESICTAEKFAQVHEEYVTDWSFSKAEKWSQQDIENAPARRTKGGSPLHSDAESDGSEDLESCPVLLQ